MDGRVKRSKPVVEELSAKPGEAVPFQEYKGYMVINDSPGRIVIAERGLYVTEFSSANQAKEYIDNVR